jgi:hypothetical protein
MRGRSPAAESAWILQLYGTVEAAAEKGFPRRSEACFSAAGEAAF